MKYFPRFRSDLFFIISLFSVFSLISQTKIIAQTVDEEEISVDSSLVIINAVVTDKNGKPVFGLKKSDFKVFEDGKDQEETLDFFQAQETPFAVVILMDTSGSMQQRVTLARSAAINFLTGLRSEDNVAIYNFDSKVSLVQDFSNTQDINEKAFNLKSDGMTVLNDAIYQAANELGKSAEKRRAIVVLSDGADTRSKYSSNKALKAALDANALIYTVDMASPESGMKDKIVNQGALKNFAEKSGGKYVSTPGGVQLTGNI